MGANGRVLIGFSHPVVAKYNQAGNTVTYTDGRALARGVKFSLNLETSDDNDFYADDAVAESENGVFAGGTAAVTVDGMHPESERFILGLPEPEEVNYGENQKVSVAKFGENAAPPYLGYGHIARYQSDNVEIFVPTIFTKVKFRQPGVSAETKGEKKNWQTHELTADLHRDDTANHDWKWVCADQASMEDAVAVLHGLLNVPSGEAAE